MTRRPTGPIAVIGWPSLTVASGAAAGAATAAWCSGHAPAAVALAATALMFLMLVLAPRRALKTPGEGGDPLRRPRPAPGAGLSHCCPECDDEMQHQLRLEFERAARELRASFPGPRPLARALTRLAAEPQS
ncbi:hypothetical protein Celgi_1335 [Cellulomonas gilvus ATCC 13127]|uniref:Uncharacterized protein n=1 Tax=Cellulomonas gilvus (strain ATCC 13127 / NRRL B-14078) TaxID=593907 RepID=F8A2Z9_CELGA|nr:hypothetical protein Celgi_1335 [Cellulomonas gilvus ATCC 13127]